ncbi:hypothetical protein DL89DRAFT_292109 [Linderina pennispora]|uniref:Uncharacterized protein n=1 Tax=Linderina pennispora TaxID=61395 RepID=A0A1Y1WDY6_9FUNG|nr:uncharacterized protein DL89DRAFT_292109 [Linderina pennispora]ORX71672.1 hypothetical protein DL89DRAFT_292109 [Linderina pennispora]
MADEVSLSIEETNRLRISLGLPPLEVGPQDAKPKELQERIEKSKAARKEQKLKASTRTLGEVSDDDDDSLSANAMDRAQQAAAGRLAEAAAEIPPCQAQ